MLNDNVIASSGNAVGEITRGFAWQVDEDDVDAVAAAMRALLAGERAPRTMDRQQVLAKFSWGDAAQRALAIFGSYARPPSVREFTA